jgi:cytoskeletal protein CcmA (bactofilin family)
MLKFRKRRNVETTSPAPGHNPVDGLTERSVNLIAPGTHLKGQVHFDRTTRIAGRIEGSIEGAPSTTLILTEEGMIEGDIRGDSIYIEGFVEGEINATTRIQIAPGGRVIGNLTSPSIQVDFGAWFEGECRSGKKPDAAPVSPPEKS